MRLYHRGRFFFWIAKELFAKYKKSLSAGVILGAVFMFLLWKLFPVIKYNLLSPVERIAVVGEYTPSTLPIYIQKQISFGLVKLTQQGLAIGDLAYNWEATDSGKSYVFRLRNDVNWPDGEKVTAKDVNYNIRDVQFEALDDFTLKVTLKSAYSPLPTLLTKPIIRRGLQGFGEYKVDNLVLKGDFIQYLRLVTDSSALKPIIEYRFYRTETQAITAYKLGDVDILYDLDNPSELATWTGTVVDKKPLYDEIVAIFFNLKDQLLSEKSIRQALGYAIPETTNERSYSPLNKFSWAYTDKIRRYTPNLAQAKKILTFANIDLNGKEVVIITFPDYLGVAQSIANSWGELGLVAKVKVENSLPPDFQILLSAQLIPPDPDQYPFWHSTQQNTNITGLANVKIDKILEDARIEQDLEKRKKLYIEFQRFLVEDAPAIFYFYPNHYTVRRV